CAAIWFERCLVWKAAMISRDAKIPLSQPAMQVVLPGEATLDYRWNMTVRQLFLGCERCET
ncbi:MAG: hypothetical protein MUO67_13715, partial [Anaerolineales bacterium]|nr:hypothetical protein [Anaerolineales bacterium]